MLENIKLILNITDDKYDNLINLYIDKITNNILAYCNIDELNPALEGFVEDKVISIIQSKVTGEVQNTGQIKSVTRGDTRIEYNVSDSVSPSISSSTLTDSDKSFLKAFRKVVMH